MLEYMPEHMPDRMLDRMPADLSEYMPEDMRDRMPDRMPARMPKDVPEDVPEHMPEDMSDRMPEDLPDRMPEDLPDRMPDKMSDRMPEDMPDRMPEDLPDNMPEDMSNRMPEGLPVRKSINVMVGITRSKVICSDSQKPPILSVQRRDRVPPPFLVSTVNFNRPSSGKLLILHYFTALLCILFQRLGLLGDIFIAHCKHFRGVSCTPNWSRAERNSHVCIGIWHSAPSRSGPGPMAAYGILWQPMA